MEIIRISDKDGIVVYERIRHGEICPKYVIVNDKTGTVIGEARKRKGAEKLARTMRKVSKVFENKIGSTITAGWKAPEFPTTPL